jgi:hypothetical protein
MMANLSNKRNGRKINVLYPAGGSSNVLRTVSGIKLRSGTGPKGKFITVQEKNGQIRSLTLSKVVGSLS